MKVNAVSSVGFKNSYSFGTSSKSDETGVVDYTQSSSPSLMKKVPVIVLLAMNPATLNSAIPMMPETDNPNQTVMLAPETKSPDVSAYVISPIVEELQQDDAPFGWALFKGAVDNIKFSMPAKGNGANYHMLFTAMKSDNERINNIYFVKDGSVGSVSAGDHPPNVQTLIYHNLGEDSFCSVITLENILGPDRLSNGSTLREIMLDDDSAQKIIDLVSGDTKWKNNTHIQIKEVFDAKIHKPKTTLY